MAIPGSLNLTYKAARSLSDCIPGGVRLHRNYLGHIVHITRRCLSLAVQPITSNTGDDVTARLHLVSWR